MVIELEKEFVGIGEVRGFNFKQLKQTEYAYLYEVIDEGKTHYEVFKRKHSPVCIDFQKRVYSETDFKESYPKANSFGSWAYTTPSLEKATELLDKFIPNDKE